MARPAVGGLRLMGVLDQAELEPGLGGSAAVMMGVGDAIVAGGTSGGTSGGASGGSEVEPAVAELILPDRKDHHVFVGFNPHALRHANPKPRTDPARVSPYPHVIKLFTHK